MAARLFTFALVVCLAQSVAAQEPQRGWWFSVYYQGPTIAFSVGQTTPSVYQYQPPADYHAYVAAPSNFPAREPDPQPYMQPYTQQQTYEARWWLNRPNLR